MTTLGQDTVDSIPHFEQLRRPRWWLEGSLQPKETVRIAISIVSNSRLLRDGLLAMLSQHLDLQLVGTYAGEFHSSLQTPNPPGHIVLLDSCVGRAESLHWTQYWHGLMPPAHVLMLELPNDMDLVLACIEAGASGYLFEGASITEVAQAIRDVHFGVAHCSPDITARLFARLASLNAAVSPSPTTTLTEREKEVLHYIARGFSNGEIAARLVIELRTVKQHVHHILNKLNLRSRWQIVDLVKDKDCPKSEKALPTSWQLADSAIEVNTRLVNECNVSEIPRKMYPMNHTR